MWHCIKHWKKKKKTLFTTVVYVRTYLETVKQTLKTHNGTTEGKKQRTLGGREGKKSNFRHSQNIHKKMAKKK